MKKIILSYITILCLCSCVKKERIRVEISELDTTFTKEIIPPIGTYAMTSKIRGFVNDSIKLNSQCCLIGEINNGNPEPQDCYEYPPIKFEIDPYKATEGYVEIEYIFYK